MEKNNDVIIKELAETFRKTSKANNLNNTLEIVDIWIKSLGGKILSKDDKEFFRADYHMKVLEDGTFLIKLPETTTPLEDNFVKARDIGYYLLFYKNGEGEKTFPYQSDSWEFRCANLFAKEILMPETTMKTLIDKYNKSLDLIAAELYLPTRFIAWRLEELNLS